MRKGLMVKKGGRIKEIIRNINVILRVAIGTITDRHMPHYLVNPLSTPIFLIMIIYLWL